MILRWRALASLAWREGRAARRRLFLASSSITLGVAALVAIDSFSENVTTSVREQSRSILGGDVTLSSRRAFPAEVTQLIDSLDRAGHTIARETSFPAMGVLGRSGATRLVMVRAVSDSFPLYGEITTEPALSWPLLRSQAVAVVDPSLLIALDAKLGDTLSIGFGRFVIAATIRSAPAAQGFAQVLGPRVFIPERYAPETQLLLLGSTSSYETLIRARGSAQALGRDLRERLRDGDVRVRTVEQTEAGLTEAIDQLRQFVGIVGIVALLLGGLGVASGVHAFVARKIDTVAILRCLGATSGQVVVIYVVQAAIMGVAGAAIGAAVGVGFQMLLPQLVAGLLPLDVTARLAPRAILLGLGVGAWVALIFALRPLLALRRVSPLQTLRRDADASVLRASRREPVSLAVTALIVASVVAIAFARASEPRIAIAIALGTGLAIGTLLLSAWLLSTIARRLLRARWPYVMRQGISNLYRPGNQTRPVVLALGFGAFLVTTLFIVHSSVIRRFQLAAAATGANVAFFDVQEDQARGLDSLVRRSGADVLQLVPIVTMRIAAVGDRRTADYLADTTSRPARRGRWALRWEYRSTFRDSLTAGERIVEGERFSGPAPAMAEISIERDLARDLGVGVGDTITWDVQGSELASRVASLREVTWARFEPNFLVVFRPAALDDAPKQFVLVGRTAGPAETARLQRDVVARYANISSIDLSLVRQSLDEILGRVSQGIRFLAVLSLVMGIPVMLSAVAATRRDRVREAVLLKTLGATRGTVARIMATEYAALGLLGSLTGLLLAVAAGWGLTHYVFKLPLAGAVSGPLAIAAAMVGLTLTIGMFAAREVFRRTPMDALRDSG